MLKMNFEKKFLRAVLQIFTIIIFSYANITINDNHVDNDFAKELQREQEFYKNITFNWTSCEEFLGNSTFDVKTVVDIDWQIFYFWNYKDEHSYNIRFSIPSSILVDRFEVGLKDMKLNVNWSQAALFMETTIDFSALFITTEIPGQFRIIPSFAFEMDRIIPDLIFGLKVVEPGYLAIMSCQQKLCYALAPSDKMPKQEDVLSAAKKIGFRGNFNYSYNRVDKDSLTMHDPMMQEDDEADEEEFEIENQLDEL